MIFAGWWKGYAPGFENSFPVDVAGERKVLKLTHSATSYGSNFTYLPLNIVKKLFEFKPDLVFSNSFGVWTILALLFKPLGRWRVVIAYEGSSPGVDYRNSAVRLLVRRMMVQVADACITNSQAGKAYLIDVLRARSDRVFAHPYEVPSSKALSEQAIAQQLPDTPLQHPIFLFVGSVESRKGLHLLLEACTILASRGSGTYTLTIVGDGEKRSELEEYCQTQGLQDRVQWVGRVEYGQLGAFFLNADVFILPTLEDTWGVVVSEAMALGKAILCSKWAGAVELVVHGENGYVFDPHDPTEIAAAMQHFIEDPGLSMRMGRRSKELIEQYTPEHAAKFLAQVATSVLGMSQEDN